MGELIAGRSYLPVYPLRGVPYWSSPFGYKVFEEFGGLFTMDGDGDKRPICFLDPSSEVVHSLENE